MRTRTIIRDMADGEAAAWALAEAKLQNPRTHPENLNRLREAMAELSDRRPADG